MFSFSTFMVSLLHLNLWSIQNLFCCSEVVFRFNVVFSHMATSYLYPFVLEYSILLLYSELPGIIGVPLWTSIPLVFLFIYQYTLLVFLNVLNLVKLVSPIALYFPGYSCLFIFPCELQNQHVLISEKKPVDISIGITLSV